MRKIEELGINELKLKIIQNLADLYKLIHWNEANGIKDDMLVLQMDNTLSCKKKVTLPYQVPFDDPYIVDYYVGLDTTSQFILHTWILNIEGRFYKLQGENRGGTIIWHNVNGDDQVICGATRLKAKLVWE